MVVDSVLSGTRLILSCYSLPISQTYSSPGENQGSSATARSSRSDDSNQQYLHPDLRRADLPTFENSDYMHQETPEEADSTLLHIVEEWFKDFP